MDFTSWAYLIGNFGLPIAMVIYFLKRDRHRDQSMEEREREHNRQAEEREKRLGARIDELESRDRNVLIDLVTNSTVSIKENYRALRRLGNSTDDMVNALKTRTCMAADAYAPHPVHEHFPKPYAPKPTDHSTGDTTEETTNTSTSRKDKS